MSEGTIYQGMIAPFFKVLSNRKDRLENTQTAALSAVSGKHALNCKGSAFWGKVYHTFNLSIYLSNSKSIGYLAI